MAALGTGLGVVLALATGTVSIVETHGTSMLPRFHSGDLALVWASGHYHVGQIVAYWSPLLHMVVLHRIVASGGGLFTFKGDNNSFLDPLRLPASDIKGSLLLHVPKAGGLLVWLKDPFHLVLVIALLVVAFGGGAAKRRADLLDGPGPGSATLTKATSRAKRPGDAPPLPLALPIAVAVACAAIAAVGWARPEERPGTEPVAYQQRVGFSYSAQVAQSMVYPGGVVHTGQPVFLNLVHSLEVTTHYSFVTTAEHTPLVGTMSEEVQLVYGTGWSSPLEQVAPVRLRGSQGTATVSINLVSVAKMITAADNATGVAAMPALVVTPTITFRGTVIRQTISGRFSPALTWNVGSSELVLMSQPGTGGGPSYPQLRQSSSGAVNRRVVQPVTLTILGRSVRVSIVRWTGATGAAASLAWALIVLGWGIWLRRRDEAALIEALYGAQLIRVRSSPEDNDRTVVDVVGVSALAKLAENFGSVILDYNHDGVRSYFVDARTTVYRYRPGLAVELPVEYGPAADGAGGADVVPEQEPVPLDLAATSTGLLGVDLDLALASSRQPTVHEPGPHAARAALDEASPAQSLLAAEWLRSDADRAAQLKLDAAERTARHIVEEAKAVARRAHLESKREVAAAMARRDSIDAQLASLNRAFETLSGPLLKAPRPVGAQHDPRPGAD